MDYSKTPLWMQDDLVKDIPREKLDFLSKLFAQGHGKSQKEMMALLMPAMRKAKQEHLTFTPQEMQAAITAIKKYSTESELRQIENILENSDFITLLNQASGDRKILSERLNLSADQQKYIDNSEPGEGLLIFENVVLPFSNPIPKNTQLYKIMTTRLSEVVEL